jgi:hypothetical protein
MIENCKNELKKLYKTIELNRITLSQYENVIKEQQDYIEQFRNRSIQLPQKHHRPTILSEQNENKIDDLIINLDIDICPLHETKTRMLFFYSTFYFDNDYFLDRQRRRE